MPRKKQNTVPRAQIAFLVPEDDKKAILKMAEHEGVAYADIMRRIMKIGMLQLQCVA